MIFTEISNVNDAIYIHLDKDAHSSKSQAEASSKVMIDICYIHDFFYIHVYKVHFDWGHSQTM